MRHTPHGAKAAALFLKHLFLLIHSDMRVLCMTDAALFAGVGYFLGSALWGAILGGLFGVLNYKVVSEYILGIVPAK